MDFTEGMIIGTVTDGVFTPLPAHVQRGLLHFDHEHRVCQNTLAYALTAQTKAARIKPPKRKRRK